MSAFKISHLLLAFSLTVAFGAFGVHESVAVTPESALTLSGDDEVPPVKNQCIRERIDYGCDRQSGQRQRRYHRHRSDSSAHPFGASRKQWPGDHSPRKEGRQ